MVKDPHFHEGEILDAIEKIGQYIHGMDFEQFRADEMRFDACCMKLQHIGECGIKMSKIVPKGYKNIPFIQMAGFRNQLSHDYAGIDDELIWDTIQKSLPELKKLLFG